MMAVNDFLKDSVWFESDAQRLAREAREAEERRAAAEALAAQQAAQREEQARIQAVQQAAQRQEAARVQAGEQRALAQLTALKDDYARCVELERQLAPLLGELYELDVKQRTVDAQAREAAGVGGWGSSAEHPQTLQFWAGLRARAGLPPVHEQFSHTPTTDGDRLALALRNLLATGTLMLTDAPIDSGLKHRTVVLYGAHGRVTVMNFG